MSSSTVKSRVSDDVPSNSAALTVSELSKSFPATLALDRVSLEIAPGEVHALLGENGSGKSTLIKCLSGYYRPDAGEVHVGGEKLHAGSAESAFQLGCRFVHQDLGLVNSLSIADNLYMSSGYPTFAATIRPKKLVDRAAADLARVGLSRGVDPRTPVGDVPAAVRTGVAIARALKPSPQHEVRLLVLDEPTATLPHDQVDALLDIVRAASDSGVGVMYVTHRVDELIGFADRLTVLRDGRRVATRAVRGLDHRALVHILVGSELDDVRVGVADLHAQPEVVLSVESLCAGPLQGVSLKAHAGEILGVAGIVGSGREALLPAIFGAMTRSGGKVSVSGRDLKPSTPGDALRAGVAYLPADRKTLGGVMGLSARENLVLPQPGIYWRKGFLRRRPEVKETRAWFERLSVRPADGYDRPLAGFSGGNQQKILFAKWLRLAPRAWLLDEPTQGVDIQAKGELHKHLISAAASGMAVLISSADSDEMLAICHRIVVLRNGEIVRTLEGAELTNATITREILGARSHRSEGQL